MLRGNWRGRSLGSGSDALEVLGRAPRRPIPTGLGEMEAGIARSHGTCMTMGTAAR